MRNLLLYFMILLCFKCNAQILNTLIETKKYSSQTELLKARPELNKNKIVVDSQSIKILNEKNSLKREISKSIIPKNLNSFIFSPIQDYFVAFEETENETEDLFFFKGDGTLLSKQTINIHPNVKFSSNGEFVIAFNNFGRQVFVFSKKGLLIALEDYIDLIKDKTKVLENVLVSEDASQVLINAGEEVYLIDTKTKITQFKTKVGIVLSGEFYSLNHKIALKTISSENFKFDLSVLSKSDGKILDNLSKASSIDFISTSIVVSKDTVIHEYSFK